mgnify:CR=1|jgi:hypothetical protein
MAMTKRFKKLPKAAKRAAFAAMDGRSKPSVQMKPKKGVFNLGPIGWVPQRSNAQADRISANFKKLTK